MLDAGVDWVALSFIQRPEDLAEARKIARGRALLMSKIEKPQAVARLAEIIELSDALMVARGDLGVEMPLEAVPGIQKQITRAGAPRRQAGGRRHADAGIDDHRAGADPRRSVGRRRPPCSKAPTRSCCRPNRPPAQYPVEAVATMNRIAEQGRDGPDSMPASSTRSAPSRKRPAPTPSRSPRARSPRR